MSGTSVGSFERRGQRGIARGLFVGGLLALLVLAPAACKKATPTPAPDSGLTDADAQLVGARPSLPPRVGGLAQVAVFPSVDSPLRLVQSEPADGAEGVAVGADEARIVLRFNHPVVPLVDSAAAAELPAPASIEPALDGEGVWLDTATWRFTPSEDLQPSTEYRIQLDADLTDLLGGRLGEATELRFTSAWPAVLRTWPEIGAIDAGASQPISVTFNQPVDPASAEAAFSLAPADGGPELDGNFSWRDRVMVFQPDRPLERDSDYSARVRAGVRAARGDQASPSDYVWSFRSAPLPRLVRSEPADGDRDSTALRGGDLVLRFNTPMDSAALTVTIQPTITNQGLWWNDEDREAHVSGGWLASRAYTVTVPAETPARSGDRLGEAAVIRFSVAPMAPMLNVHTTGRFSQYEAGQPVVVYADAVNAPRADFALYGIDRADFLSQAVGEDRWQVQDRYQPSEEARLRAWSLDTAAPVDVTRRVSTTLAAEPEGGLAPGLYYLEAGQPDDDRSARSRTILAVSEVNLSLKVAPKEVLVWATDLRTAEPVAGLALAVYEGPDGPLASGRTDADGIFRAPIERQTRPWEPLVALAESEGRVTAAVSSEWAGGLEPYAFNIGYDPEPRAWYGAAYTDRPLYRPAQTVHFRGVLRADEDASYRLPGIDRVRVVVRDPEWETLLETELPVSDFGSFDGSIDLSPLARLGYYQIEATLPRAEGATPEGTDEPQSLTSTGFRVAAYRKPEFEVEVTTDKPEYRQGETIAASATARYYFGGAVAGAKLRWRLLSDDFFFSLPDQAGRWDWIDYDLTEARYFNAQGEVVAEGEGETDAEGRFDFEIPADVAEYPLSQAFTIDVELTDLDNRSVAGRGSAVVHKAEVYVGLQPQAYLGQAGQAAGFDILTVDPRGAALADQSVALELYRREWFSVREKREDGAFYWTSHYTDTLVAETSVASDAEGRAEASLTPKEAGVHRLLATTRDAAGNEARSATYVWVTGKGYVNWRQENNDRIELVADKKSYAPGETARILVPAPFAGAQALVTTERGSIRSVRRLELAGNGETIEVPIGSGDAPNIYVSVLLLKGIGPDSPLPQLKLGYTNLAVSIAERELDITLEPDKTTDYGPRQTVTWTITARDHAGKPAEAELSLALVDKALLALTDETGGGLEEAFYGQRMLSVGTSAGLTQSGRRLEQELAAEKKGGGGGGPEGDGGTVRRLMQDTAYWAPAVRTDAQGRAQVSLSLPDNLTTWRMDARGVTGADTRVGSALREIVSTQDLLLRPVLPRFLVVGDAVQVETVVQNRSAEAVDVEVSLTAIGLSLSSPAQQPASVPAGGKVKLVWQATVPSDGLNPPRLPDAYGAATLQLRAAGEGPGDAIEVELPVYAFSAPEVVATAGEVEGKVTERIDLPAGADLSQGELSVEVEPSLAAAALGGQRWLADDSDACTEPIAGRLLADAALLTALDQPGAAAQVDPALRGRLEAAIPLEIQRLLGLQGGSGGWGWCGSAGEPQPWVTAYALAALTEAERRGQSISPRGIDGATSYLIGVLDAPTDAEASWDLDQRAFITWALAERQAIPVSRVLTLYERREALRTESKALLALALDRLGGSNQAPRVAGLLADLSAAAKRSATGAYWEEASEPWTMGTGTRTTATAIYALTRLDPKSTVLPAALRWLMVERREGHWETSQQTAWSVRAIAA
ncbi:MAG: Ig-like domain-containing protein, partial [Chloroflexi bacterium]|nr:Ig-like domain-containing protein [Chloroflexota bacterium]